MENINRFLKELYILKKKYDDISDAQEKFNIFSVLHKENDERRLHSRFISALLSPDGSHKQKKLFLNLFLEKLGQNIDCFENAEVFPKENNKSEDSHIDILIIDKKSKYAVIIENKIYAGDSNNLKGGQLERYYKHVRDEKKIPQKNISVFYLTLDGHEPSQESLGNIKCQCISYGEHILPWLEKCVSIVVSSPFLRESILQYIKLLKKMTNDISVEQRLELRNTISRTEDNLESVKLLLDNFKHIKWHTVRDFYDGLSEELSNSGYKIISIPFDNDDITYITHYDSYKKGYKERYRNVYLPFAPLNGLTLRIGNEYSRDLFFGCVKDKNTLPDYKRRIKIFCSGNDDYQENDGDFLFTKEFNLSKDVSVRFFDFSHPGTFWLISENYRRKIIAKMVKEIKGFVNKIEKIQ